MVPTSLQELNTAAVILNKWTQRLMYTLQTEPPNRQDDYIESLTKDVDKMVEIARLIVGRIT